MTEINKILLATDFSQCSRTALDTAIYLQKMLGCKVEVLHVYNPAVFEMSAPYAGMPGVGPWLDQHFSGMQERGRSALNELLPQLEDPCRGHFSEGRPGPSIVEFAREHKVDLIVMGTHGHRGFDHVVTGSVAKHVLRHAPCPVLTVKTGIAYEASGGNSAS